MKIKYLILFILASLDLPTKNIAHNNTHINNIKIINKKVILMMVTNDGIVDDYCGSGQREWFDVRPCRCRSKHRWQREIGGKAVRHMHWRCTTLLSLPPSVLLCVNAEGERGWRWVPHYRTSSSSSSTICIGSRGGRGERVEASTSTSHHSYSIFLL